MWENESWNWSDRLGIKTWPSWDFRSDLNVLISTTHLNVLRLKQVESQVETYMIFSRSGAQPKRCICGDLLLYPFGNTATAKKTSRQLSGVRRGAKIFQIARMQWTPSSRSHHLHLSIVPWKRKSVGPSWQMSHEVQQTHLSKTTASLCQLILYHQLTPEVFDDTLTYIGLPNVLIHVRMCQIWPSMFAYSPWHTHIHTHTM